MQIEATYSHILAINMPRNKLISKLTLQKQLWKTINLNVARPWLPRGSNPVQLERVPSAVNLTRLPHYTNSYEARQRAPLTVRRYRNVNNFSYR